MSARILVTGSRAWTSVYQMRRIIRDTLREFGTDATLIHGNASGADRLAASIAEHLGATPEAHSADWEAPCRPACRPGHRRKRRDDRDFCPAAGDYRNQEMVDLGADVVLAFLVDPPISPCKGTRDCAGRAKGAGIPVRWYAQEAAR